VELAVAPSLRNESHVHEDDRAVIFDIQRFSVHDGPGIRTLVFFKGCPLRCAWCSNPESQSSRPELVFMAARCIGCGNCVATCPEGACRVDGHGQMRFDRALCTSCGACAETCYAGARVLLGRRMTIEDVLSEVRKDEVFYRNSGGGVTLSGGEPALWPQFTARLLAALKAEGMHTAMETCGQVPCEEIERLLPDLDLLLYDIKHIDPVEHEQHTGATNERILANLRRLARSDVEVSVRVPVVPGFNDDPAAIAEIAGFVGTVGVHTVHLLPYHRYAQDKYARLGRTYALTGLMPPQDEHMHELAELVRSHGLACRVGG
jgi:pyruvate formate lyase activating enzyme